MFQLHPQLAADSIYIGHAGTCHVRLMNNSALPWFLLIPEFENASEVFDLPEKERTAVWALANRAGQSLRRYVNADNINIAALGNVVPQLHVHVIARFKNDPAWPKPVWGNLSVTPYSETDLPSLLKDYRDLLGLENRTGA